MEPKTYRNETSRSRVTAGVVFLLILASGVVLLSVGGMVTWWLETRFSATAAAMFWGALLGAFLIWLGNRLASQTVDSALQATAAHAAAMGDAMSGNARVMTETVRLVRDENKYAAMVTRDYEKDVRQLATVRVRALGAGDQSPAVVSPPHHVEREFTYNGARIFGGDDEDLSGDGSNTVAWVYENVTENPWGNIPSGTAAALAALLKASSAGTVPVTRAVTLLGGEAKPPTGTRFQRLRAQLDDLIATYPDGAAQIGLEVGLSK